MIDKYKKGMPANTHRHETGQRRATEEMGMC